MRRITPPEGAYRAWGKRLLDLVVAVPLAVLTAPLVLVVALLVRWRMGGPILFRQERVGKDDRIFRLAKFRTMTDARDAAGELLPDGQRLTALGLFLRKTSLDELPQLLNVIRGEMSLVGPRPLLVRYLPRYSQEQRRRHVVPPGITGLAQITGRNRLGWDARFALDLDYVGRQSLGLDLWILWRTFVGLGDTSATLPRGTEDVAEFMGSGSPVGEPASPRMRER